jgi:hypothetical protein
MGKIKKYVVFGGIYISLPRYRECFGIYLMIKDKILTNFKDR